MPSVGRVASFYHGRALSLYGIVILEVPLKSSSKLLASTMSLWRKDAGCHIGDDEVQIMVELPRDMSQPTLLKALTLLILTKTFSRFSGFR